MIWRRDESFHPDTFKYGLAGFVDAGQEGQFRPGLCGGCGAFVQQKFLGDECEPRQRYDSSMIERFHTIATSLHRFRPLLVVLGALSLLLVALNLFENRWLQGDELLIPAIIGFCWLLTLYSIASVFAVVPQRADADAGILRRLGALMWILAVVMLGLTLTLLLFTYQMLQAWFMA